MSVALVSRKMAQEAFERVRVRQAGKEEYRKEYRSFAREFPTLVHQSGLAQAAAFARAKKKHHLDYLEDLAAVLGKAGHQGAATAEALAAATRQPGVSNYLRLSRDALAAAVWLKRYVEALLEDKKERKEDPK
jgi:CRISPR-associated protein Cmr5